MNKTIASLLVAIATASPVRAAFVPANVTGALVPPQMVDVRDRTAHEIEARARAGYKFATVDMDGASWKVENQIMKELQAQGYTVEYCPDHHHYGWNNLNGGLFIRWAK